MRTDREMLELAAKAAGIDVLWSIIWGRFIILGTDAQPLQEPCWEPLTDKFQAQELAETLGLGETDPRAIVRAAAEIGAKLVPEATNQLPGGSHEAT